MNEQLHHGIVKTSRNLVRGKHRIVRNAKQQVGSIHTLCGLCAFWYQSIALAHSRQCRGGELPSHHPHVCHNANEGLSHILMSPLSPYYLVEFHRKYIDAYVSEEKLYLLNFYSKIKTAPTRSLKPFFIFATFIKYFHRNFKES